VVGASSNERLEFLGDAVLGLVVGEHLYAALPDVPEGDLARMRAAVVSEEALAPVAGALGLGEALRLGRGEVHSGGRSKPSILADALEAVFGATFLAGGLDPARRLVLDVMGPAIAGAVAVDELGDPKNRLQELGARLGLGSPRYELDESGPDHAKRYRARVVIDAPDAGGPVTGLGSGRSKKQAERGAAVEALDELERRLRA
jgi:ribonuclease-3